MAKELFISSSPHEMKVAVLEDDQLVEVYHERDTDVGLVGGIYKGRVSRVLPGMQSAFVNIGLERDAFLYVSDFFLEDMEDYDKLIEEAETRVERPGALEASSRPPQADAVARQTTAENVSAAPPQTQPEADPPAPVATPPATPPGPASEPSALRRHEGRGRRRRRPGRGYVEPARTPRPEPVAPSSFEVLPGESLAKYSHVRPEQAPPSYPEAASGEEAAASLADAENEATSLPPDVTEAVSSGHRAVFAEPPETETPATQTGEVSAPMLEAVAELASDKDDTDAIATEAMSAAMEVAGETSHPAPSDDMGARLTEHREPIEEEYPAARLDHAPSASIEPPADLEQPEGHQATAYPSSPEEGEAVAADSEAEVDTAHPEEDDAATVWGSPGALLIGSAPGTPEAAVSDEAAPGPPAETPADSSKRSYTLREPHQRPRFAPRRGRRGPRGARPPFRQESSRQASPAPQISQLLKEGQEILVQIAKEPLGTKGARITSHIALPGRYLVFMPTIHHIGISRKISDEGERLRLRNIILENKGTLNGGFIVRTAGEGRSEDEFKADLKFLTTLWNNIRTKAERLKAPALIHRDLDLIQRLLRDILSPDFKSVRVDNEIDYERVLDFVNQCQPSLVGHVKLYTRDTPLFEEFGIQTEIEKALRPKIWLKSGGYIVINQTEALVAIDVNTGKYVGKTNRLEDTILKINVEAVNEIVRQLRLRDLGGIIVVDFIDMEERKNRHKVVQTMEEALRRDRAPTKVVAFNDFGLVGITRKRVRQSLERTLCEPCSYCSGAGWVKSAVTVCYEILGEVRRMARQIEGNTITLRVNPEVGKALKSRDGVFISEMESLTHKDIIIKSDPAVQQERFEIF